MTSLARSRSRPASQNLALLALVGGLFLASTGLIAIRFAQQDGMPTSLIVMLRLAIGTLVFTPLTLPRHLPRIRRMPRRALLLLLLAGISLCADLMLFVEAIKYVNILLATIIVSLMPLITALMERYLLKAPLQRSMYAGMVLAMAGVLIIAFGSSNGNSDLGPNPLLGTLLAFLSVLSACTYLIISRKLRARIPLLPYTWMLFGTAAIVSMVVVLPTAGNLGAFSTTGLVWALFATIVSQLMAHPAFIFAVGTLSPTLISIASQSIILFGSVLAFLFLGQTPGVAELIGGAIILAGVFLAINGQRQP